MDTSQQPPDLEPMRRLLDRQLEALARVLELLGDEQQALLSRDASSLELVTASKSQALARSDELEQQRRSLAPSLSDMERLAADESIARLWEKLLEMTRQCREQNDANGRLIRRQQQRVESALGLLCGKPTTENADLYGPDGEQRRKPGPSARASV